MSILKYLLEELVNEEVYGKIATVYHRAKSPEDSESIIKTGFKIGGGAGWLYGPGVYACYDYKSQLNANHITKYGKYLIKAKINLSGFLILEEPEAKAVYGQNYKLVNQFKSLISTQQLKQFSKKNNENQLSFIEFLEGYEFGKYEFSSKFALTIWEDYLSKTPKLLMIINGLMFNGSNDGNVAVVYDNKNIKPIGWVEADTTDKTFIPTFKLMSDKDTLKNVQKRTRPLPKEYKYVGYNELKKMIDSGYEITLNTIINTKDLDIIKYVVSLGAEVDNDYFKNNSLDYATQTKDLDIIKYIVSLGATLGFHTLTYAVETKDLDIIKYIRSLGAKLRPSTLTHAMETKDLDIIKYIGSLGAKPDVHTLNEAIETKDLDLIKYIGSLGAKPNEYSISYALQTGNPDIISYIKSYVKAYDDKHGTDYYMHNN